MMHRTAGGYVITEISKSDRITGSDFDDLFSYARSWGESRVLSHKETLWQLRSSLLDPCREMPFLLIAKNAQRIVGMAGGIVTYTSDGGLRLRRSFTAVCPSYRRRGVGTLLIREKEDYLRREGVLVSVATVSESNEASLSMLMEAGYTAFDSYENTSGVTLILMSKNL